MSKKTQFFINYANHDGIESVVDFCTHTADIIRYAGYESKITNEFNIQGITIIFEYFEDDFLTFLLNFKLNGGRYILIATEFIINGVFNGHIKRDENNGYYGYDSAWTIRYRNFLEAAAFAEEVWVASVYQIEQYKALLPDIPVKALPWGYDPYFLQADTRDLNACDIDVLFTGSITTHRYGLLSEISKRFRLHIPEFGRVPDLLRRELLARSKTTIHLGLTPNAVYTSPMRHHYALMNGVAVVSERSQLPGELDDCVLIAAPDDIVEKIDELLTTQAWAGYGLSMRDRYRTQHALDQRLKDLLEQWD